MKSRRAIARGGCPCQFNALPTTGLCEALVAARIREGHFGSTPLDGLTFAAAYWWPGPIHEGNGIVQLAIDERATPAQRAAMLAMTSGQHGGTFFAKSVASEPAGSGPETGFHHAPNV